MVSLGWQLRRPYLLNMEPSWILDGCRRTPKYQGADSARNTVTDDGKKTWILNLGAPYPLLSMSLSAERWLPLAADYWDPKMPHIKSWSSSLSQDKMGAQIGGTACMVLKCIHFVPFRKQPLLIIINPNLKIKLPYA